MQERGLCVRISVVSGVGHLCGIFVHRCIAVECSWGVRGRSSQSDCGSARPRRWRADRHCTNGWAIPPPPPPAPLLTACFCRSSCYPPLLTGRGRLGRNDRRAPQGSSTGSPKLRARQKLPPPPHALSPHRSASKRFWWDVYGTRPLLR